MRKLPRWLSRWRRARSEPRVPGQPGGAVEVAGPVMYRHHGPCPLDGFQLVEFLDHPLMPGHWDHSITPADLRGLLTLNEALATIAQAHAFETVVAAEQITRHR